MHSQMIDISFLAQRNRIVQILSVLSVNGHHSYIPQIQSAVKIPLI